MKSPQEDLRLNAALTSPGLEQMRDAVRALPEEVPSLVWQSRLNERLAQEAAGRRRRARAQWWRRGSLATVGLAAAMGLWLIAHPPTSPVGASGTMAQAKSVEQVLVTIHRETASSMDVSNATAGANRLPTVDAPESNMFQWTQEDLESL